MATAVATPASNGPDRRQSGRATRTPTQFSQEHHQGSVNHSAKRRHQLDGNGDDDNSDDEVSESDDNDEERDGEEPDEEEVREQNRKKRTKKPPTSGPAAKRTKTAKNASTTLAIRSANAPKKAVSKVAKQKARSRPSQVEATGLYADVFGKGNDAEAASNSWHSNLASDHVDGIRTIVNLVLQTAGADANVTTEDIDDADHIPQRLEDIITEYANQKHEDYPLSGKQKQYHGMNEVFSDFFRAITHALHNSSLMYEEAPIWENLHTWVATMSGASYRSFRHTATTASLAMATGLTEIGKEIRASMSVTKQQLDAEKKKKNHNKGRVTTLEGTMEQEEKKLEQIDAQIDECFDTVFVHRYRDVDEKLRTECAASLGSWILNYRSKFLEGTFLRYLGWVMSDPNAGTRIEVVRQLRKIYGVKNNLPALRGFSEKFRSRMVEMGVRDADLTVRVEVLELLNQLRGAELLEPEDIDTIGQLIFDNEPRIRQAVAKFFVSNIEDLYAASVEDFDAQEYDEALPDVEKIDDFDEPCKLWIKFKCLAQTLGSQTKALTRSNSHRRNASTVEGADSRYMIATQAIFNSMPELSEWEALAGYLIFDHSNVSPSKKASNLSNGIQQAYRLENGEDIILLDVLYCAAKLDLTAKPEHGKKLTKVQREEQKAKEETATHNLSVFIPKLHSKYDSDPQAVKSILRLHLLYDSDLVDDADEGEGDTAILLENIYKQFTSQNDAEVLAEAGRALRALLGKETSREAAGKKVNDIWHELVTNDLTVLLKGQNAGARGTLEREKTRQLADVTSRLVHLASVKDCCSVIEDNVSATNKRAKQQSQSLMALLLQLIHKGELDDDTPKEAARLEDQTCKSAMTVLSFYYRWKVVSISAAITANNRSELSSQPLTELAAHKHEYVEALIPVISSRKNLDSIRVAGLLSLMDLHVLFATLRHKKPQKGHLDEDVQSNINNLVTELSDSASKSIVETHELLEKRLGQKLNKKNIELPLSKGAKKRRGETEDAPDMNGHAEEEEIDRPPEDSDDEDARARDSDDDLSESDAGSQSDTGLSSKEVRRKATVVAEKALCEFAAKMVLATFSGVVPKTTEIKKRLQLNRTKLGKSYTQVIAYLDEKKDKSKSKAKAAEPKTPTKKAANGTAAKAPQPLELSDDEIEDEEEANDEDPGQEGLADEPGEESDADDNEDAEDNNEAAEDDVMGD